MVRESRQMKASEDLTEAPFMLHEDSTQFGAILGLDAVLSCGLCNRCISLASLYATQMVELTLTGITCTIEATTDPQSRP